MLKGTQTDTYFNVLGTRGAAYVVATADTTAAAYNTGEGIACTTPIV